LEGSYYIKFKKPLIHYQIYHRTQKGGYVRMHPNEAGEPLVENRVDFAYAFAIPHRMTVACPESSDKTLLDLLPGSLKMAWTYEDLTSFPLMALMTPKTTWNLRLTPEIDSHPFARSTWTRAEQYLPILKNTYFNSRGCMLLEVVGGPTAAVIRATVTNMGDKPHQYRLRCEIASGYNPAWVDPVEAADALLAALNDRADRVLILGVDAEEYPVLCPTTICMAWNLRPGETRTGWMVRPYRAYADDLPALRAHNWKSEFEEAKVEWLILLSRASRVHIPDPGVQNAFYACLADLFIMREPVAGGAIAGMPGTEIYRAPNSFEAGIAAIALDQVGFHQEAESGYRVCLEQQELNGNWSEPKGWGHLMWGASGFKSWVAIEHYQLTGDRDYLSKVYSRMAASSRWQERQRARTRVMGQGARLLTYGLMPRGMGDCGLKDDDDLYGVFIPHNIWAVYADRLSVEAAKILGKTEDLPELENIYQTALDDLLKAIDRSAIQEDGYRWIPGVPGKTSGSRWGVLNALFPCGLLPPDHELISGTIRHIEAHLSPGGIPIHTGWMVDGMWVAITLDNLAEAHLVRGNGDSAVEYLYAVLNHGTPLYTWCEERGQEPGTDKISGDRQHLWTPVAVVRAIRDSLVMEQSDGLHLAIGTARSWLASGRIVGITNAVTHFGQISFKMQYDQKSSKLTGHVDFPPSSSLTWAKLHIRVPNGLRVVSINPESGACIEHDGSGIRWLAPRGEITFEAVIT
jgi:hypothetical protein